MILVTTAGKVGSEASRLVGQQGVPVRVIVRNAERAGFLAIEGVDVFKGDLEALASVDAAMERVSSVVLVTPPVVRQELNVIDSAVRAGVEHVVKITTKASADSPIARWRNHAKIERALIAAGLGYTLLRNNAYMQNFLVMAPGIATANSFSTAAGHGRVGHRRRARCRRRCRRDRRFTVRPQRKDLLADRARGALRDRGGGGALQGARSNDHLPADHLRGAKAGDARRRATGSGRR